MSHVTRAVFAAASLILLLLAAGLVFVGLKEAAGVFVGSGEGSGDALLDTLGYVIVAIAVFDVAKYLFEDEVTRGAEKRSASEARRSLTKFLSTIIIALFLEGLVLVFKTARDDVAQMGYPTALIVASVLVLVGLGVFQRLSATVEEKVGDDDEAEAAEDEGRPARPSRSRAGTAKR
jgi:hypothetical protein